MHDDDLPAFVERLGLPGLFDVHVHFMHPVILAKVWEYFDAAGPKLGRPWPIRYRGSDDERARHLLDMGVRHYSALSYAHRPGVAAMMNDWNAEFARQRPESLWSATFYPEPEAGEYVERLLDDGVEVFKVHVQVGDFPVDHPLLEPVWARLAVSGTPVVLHAGSGPVAGQHTGSAGVARLLARHPALSLIIAHLGMPEIAEFLDLAERYENVRLDTTMVFVDFWDPFPAALLPRVEAMGDKILFGTDYPNIPYEYAHQVEALERLGFGDDWLRAVLWHNAATLFNR